MGADFLIRAGVVTLGIPIFGFLLGIAFDRLSVGRPAQLNLLALVLAALSSGLLLALPLGQHTAIERGQVIRYPGHGALGVEGLRAAGITAMPVVVAAIPLLAGLLERGRFERQGHALVLVLRLGAALILAGWMYLGAASLIGFFYLPSVVAMGLTALRSWARVEDRGRVSRVGAATVALWNAVAINFLFPLLFVALYIAWQAR